MWIIKKAHWQNRPEAKIIEKILSAFPATIPPDEKNIVAAGSAHLAVCDECRDAQQYFAGKTREPILEDEGNYPYLVNAFDFFTPEAWHYYLPVFLIQDLLRGRHRFNFFWHHDEPVVIEEFWPPRVELLSGQQVEALLEYLESHTVYVEKLGHREELCRVVEWWQSIYEEKSASVPRRV
jgi:hypothetical protein